MHKLFVALVLTLSSFTALHGAPEILTTADGTAVGAAGWSDGSGGFRIDSNVTESAGVYTYSYWITNRAEWYLGEDISAFTIGIGDQTAGVADIIKDMQVITNASTLNLDLNNFDLNSYGSLGNLYGLEFGLNSGLAHLYLEFQSYLQPMMGDFFATGQNGAYAFNSMLDSSGFGQIYVPNAVNIPEPGTYLLMGTMLMVVMMAKRKRPLRVVSGI